MVTPGSQLDNRQPAKLRPLKPIAKFPYLVCLGCASDILLYAFNVVLTARFARRAVARPHTAPSLRRAADVLARGVAQSLVALRSTLTSPFSLQAPAARGFVVLGACDRIVQRKRRSPSPPQTCILRLMRRG